MLAERFGKNGRRRVEEHFSWTAIAHQTMELDRALVSNMKSETRVPVAEARGLLHTVTPQRLGGTKC